MDVLFLQDNFYFFCETGLETAAQNLDGYEAAERFTLELVRPELAIRVNRRPGGHGSKHTSMFEREARVLEMLKSEGYFDR